MRTTRLSGELAALGTALAFAFGSTSFTVAGRRIGAQAVNQTRLMLALLIMAFIHTLVFGQPLPLDAGAGPWFWLGISGFIGFTLGDMSLFQAFVMIGPRLSMLLMALAPVIATFIAWVFLGETLSGVELVGIALSISGVAWVVTEPSGPPPAGQIALTAREFRMGLLFGLGGALGQALGVVTSRLGLDYGVDPLSGNVMRLLVGAVTLWLIFAVSGRLVGNLRRLALYPRYTMLLAFGTILGPVIGVWLSLIAIQNAPVGVASTLMSLTPIFLIPISSVVFRERVTRRAVFGTALALLGTAMLFVPV
jgi:drug/metabolite transporter (DMT)-like permease